ncbi:MAG: ornithine carbamoyltransferase [bacterium]|nr:ornithine carbamoyltransferase [bacterium]
MRHLLSLKEQSGEDLQNIIVLAQKIKAKRNASELINILSNKTLIMLFQKSSTRTRLSFEAGMTELGGHAIFLDQKTSQFSLTDYRDEIRAVMRFGQVLMMRALEVKDVETAAKFNQIPVIDACSEKYHPCQALGDFLTMIEHSQGLENIKKIAWLGIENNVSNTLKLACAKLGVKISIITPKRHEISIDEELNKMADDTGLVEYTTDLERGLADANYVHTDTWMDMEFFQNGQIKPEMTTEFEVRKKIFAPFQMNAKLIETYCPEAKIMHCMPCHVGYEISADAINHPHSIIFDQAENRLHIQKAIIIWLLGLENKI